MCLPMHIYVEKDHLINEPTNQCTLFFLFFVFFLERRPLPTPPHHITTSDVRM